MNWNTTARSLKFGQTIQKDSMSSGEITLLVSTGQASSGVVTAEGLCFLCLEHDSIRCPPETPESESKWSIRTVTELSQQPPPATWRALEANAFHFSPERGCMEANKMSNKHLPISVVYFGQKVSFVHVKYKNLFSATSVLHH